MKTEDELEQTNPEENVVKLTDEELKQISGGHDPGDYPKGFRYPEGQ